jgi:hypothetical protein
MAPLHPRSCRANKLNIINRLVSNRLKPGAAEVRELELTTAFLPIPFILKKKISLLWKNVLKFYREKTVYSNQILSHSYKVVC